MELEFEGFSTNHPLLVHWRKTRPLSPEAVNWAMSLLWKGSLVVALFFFAASWIMPDPRVVPFVRLTAMVVAWHGCMAAYMLWGFLDACAGTKELKKLLEEFEERHRVSGRGLQLASIWADWRLKVDKELVNLTQQVVYAQSQSSNPLDEKRVTALENFKRAFDLYEKLGLIGEGGYTSYFDRAKAQPTS